MGTGRKKKKMMKLNGKADDESFMMNRLPLDNVNEYTLY